MLVSCEVISRRPGPPEASYRWRGHAVIRRYPVRFLALGIKFNFIVTLVRSTTYVAQMALNRPEPPTTAFDFMPLDKITILSSEARPAAAYRLAAALALLFGSLCTFGHNLTVPGIALRMNPFLRPVAHFKRRR